MKIFILGLFFISSTFLSPAHAQPTENDWVMGMPSSTHLEIREEDKVTEIKRTNPLPLEISQIIVDYLSIFQIPTYLKEDPAVAAHASALIHSNSGQTRWKLAFEECLAQIYTLYEASLRHALQENKHEDTQKVDEIESKLKDVQRTKKNFKTDTLTLEYFDWTQLTTFLQLFIDSTPQTAEEPQTLLQSLTALRALKEEEERTANPLNSQIKKIDGGTYYWLKHLVAADAWTSLSKIPSIPLVMAYGFCGFAIHTVKSGFGLSWVKAKIQRKRLPDFDKAIKKEQNTVALIQNQHQDDLQAALQHEIKPDRVVKKPKFDDSEDTEITDPYGTSADPRTQQIAADAALAAALTNGDDFPSLPASGDTPAETKNKIERDFKKLKANPVLSDIFKMLELEKYIYDQIFPSEKRGS